MNNLRHVTALSVFFFLIGIGLLVVAAIEFSDVSAFVRTAKTAPGRVVGLEYRRGTDRRAGGGYVTVFTYSDATGETHTGRTDSAQNPPTHDVGEEVIVLYQPNSPATARIRGFRTLWIPATILGCLGIGSSAAGAYVFLAARKTSGTKYR